MVINLVVVGILVELFYKQEVADETPTTFQYQFFASLNSGSDNFSNLFSSRLLSRQPL